MPKSFYCSVVSLAVFLMLLLGALCTANSTETNWPTYYPLAVDQHGNIVPAGYAAGLTEIARAEAASAASAASAAAVSNATASASNTVNEIVSALTGAIGFAYVTGHTVSFAGAAAVSTNVSAQILLLQFGSAGTMTSNEVAYTGHYVWHVYSEAMNATPAIRYRTNLNATNSWQLAEFQSTDEYTHYTLNGTEYDTVYRSTVWLPTSLNSAFFMAFCEILGGGTAGGLFDIEEGFTIGGKAGFSGTIFRENLYWTYQCGALMSVTNEVPQ